MTKRAAPVTSALKAEFREEARRLIRADRAAKNAGLPQNTIGAIASALERAFKRGRDNPDDVGAPDRDWELIPPRGRDALSYLAGGAWRGLVRLLAIIDDDDRPRWVLKNRRDGARAFPPVAINPLVKLGLLASPPDAPAMLELSAAGLAAYDRYRERQSADDPTLPLAGMRPTKQGW
jgi:hypothetical protein